MRLEGKTAIVVGAGQRSGEGMGNGRATALRFAQEGAKVMAANRSIGSAEDTALMIKEQGGDCFAFQASFSPLKPLALGESSTN